MVKKEKQMTTKKTTYSVDEICQLLDSCKALRVSKIKMQGLEIDFFNETPYDEEVPHIYSQVEKLPQDQEESEQHDSQINEKALRMQELDLLRVTDPVAYDRALLNGDVVNDDEETE